MINIGGIVAIVVFYLLILFVGIWAAKKKGNGGESEEEVMLAGRNIGLFVGIFTMTGTYKQIQNIPIQWYISMFCKLLTFWIDDVYLQRHGWEVVTSPERPKKSTERDWSGVRLRSVTPSVSSLADCSSPIRWESKVTSRCSILFKTPLVNVWAACYSFRHFAVKSSGRLPH